MFHYIAKAKQVTINTTAALVSVNLCLGMLSQACNLDGLPDLFIDWAILSALCGIVAFSIVSGVGLFVKE